MIFFSWIEADDASSVSSLYTFLPRSINDFRPPVVSSIHHRPTESPEKCGLKEFAPSKQLVESVPSINFKMSDLVWAIKNGDLGEWDENDNMLNRKNCKNRLLYPPTLQPCRPRPRAVLCVGLRRERGGGRPLPAPLRRRLRAARGYRVPRRKGQFCTELPYNNLLCFNLQL